MFHYEVVVLVLSKRKCHLCILSQLTSNRSTSLMETWGDSVLSVLYKKEKKEERASGECANKYFYYIATTKVESTSYQSKATSSSLVPARSSSVDRRSTYGQRDRYCSLILTERMSSKRDKERIWQSSSSSLNWNKCIFDHNKEKINLDWTVTSKSCGAQHQRQLLRAKRNT